MTDKEKIEDLKAVVLEVCCHVMGKACYHPWADDLDRQPCAKFADELGVTVECLLICDI